MDRQIRNAGFAKLMKKRLEETHPEKAAQCSEDDFRLFLDIMFEVLTAQLKDGYRVIFEGYFSFFTKPIKRKCTNLKTKETWWTYKRRLRINPMKYVKSIAEVDITEEEYKEFVESPKREMK